MDVQVYWAAPPLKRLVLNTPPPPTLQRSPWLVGELDHLCGVENLTSAQGELSYHVVCIWEGTHEAVTWYIRCSGCGHTRERISPLHTVIHMQESPPEERLLVGCSLPFMRLARHFMFRFAVGADNVCLVGENLMCSVPAL